MSAQAAAEASEQLKNEKMSIMSVCLFMFKY